MNIPPLPELVYIPIREWIEEDAVIVIKQDAAWRALRERNLDWDIGIELEAPHTTEEAFRRLVRQCDGMGDIVYAVGGGAAADAAKFVARELDLPLICVPTALSADAFFTASSGVRRDGCVHYIETLPPEIVLLDLDVIAAAPTHLRAAGIVDVLSIATGCHDWHLAESRGKNPPDACYDPGVAAIARSILDLALACAEAAGRGDPAGLRALVNALAMEVQLCNLIGHSRPEEGSEHHFAYCAEMMLTGSGWHGEAIPALRTHGELVGPGIVLMAERQGQDVRLLRRALDDAGVPMNALPRDVTELTLGELPAYVRRHDLPYTIAWEL
ncbi:MAG: iron-containing alcohol dehydrogenase [Anaerolineae bacterium]|nr:iron-containing alcohol dehydrogenase [Anaerolineae bacterium]